MDRALAVFRCFLSSKTQAQSESRPYEISGGECSTGRGFLPSTCSILVPVTVLPVLHSRLPSMVVQAEGAGACVIYR